MRRGRPLGEKGASAVEFALVAPIFFMMMLGILELGYMVFVQSILDWSARDAARLVRTGQAQQSANALQTFQTRLCADAQPIISCGSLVYQVQVFPSWSGAQNGAEQPPKRDKNGHLISAGFTPGAGQQIVVVQVMYNYQFITTLIGGPNYSAFLSSTVAFRNEPFP
jgi:Flp pilus assembly protein TadG